MTATRTRTIVSLALAWVAACGGPTSSTDAGGGADTGPVDPPMPCFTGRLEVVPGQLASIACYPSGGGPIDSVEIASAPAGITASWVPETGGGLARVAGNLRIEVAPDAPIADGLVSAVVRGPGGQVTSGFGLAVIAREGAGIVVGLGAAEIAAHPGAPHDIPVRIVSYGGWTGDVALWIPGASTRALGARLASESGAVAPGSPFSTTLTFEERYSETGTGETLHVRAASGRHDATADLLYTIDATAEQSDVYATLTEGPLVARAGETARLGFDLLTSIGAPSDATLAVTPPPGWTASASPGGGAYFFEATPSAGAASGDAVITAMLGTAAWRGVVRLVRPPTDGAWALVGDGPLPVDSTETIDDGSEARRALDPSASYDTTGAPWTVTAAGSSVVVMRGLGTLSMLDVTPRNAIEAAITMPADDHPFVVATTNLGTHAWHYHGPGAPMPVWDPLPALDTGDMREARPLAIAHRAATLAVAFGQETPTVTSTGPASIVGFTWDGTTWLGTYFAHGSVLRTTGTSGEPQLAAALDGTGSLIVAWIDAADGAVHVERLSGTAGAILAPIAPSSGRIALGVDVVATSGDRVLVLVHEAPDLFAHEHPRIGPRSRVRVLAADASWTELADVTLPDELSTPHAATLGLGPAGAARVRIADASGVFVADLR